jgi:hypothetical protein
MNYIKKDMGKATVRLGWRIGKNGSWHWVGAERGDEMKKKKYTSYEEFGPKDLREYRKIFLMYRI